MGETSDLPGAGLPSGVDIHVGYRIRALRQAQGMSQHDLGQVMGVSAEQIQAYEAGANHVSASQLMRLSEIFGTEPTSFFEKLVDPSVSPSSEQREDFDRLAFSSSAESISLLKAFVRIKNPELRRLIIGVIETLAGKDDGE